MALWKLQAWEPDTCASPSCRIYMWWDAELAPESRVHTVAGYERVCSVHTTDYPVGKLQSVWDGNWRDMGQFIDYQRAFYRRRNHVEWLEKHPNDAMPETIAGFTSDPVSPGSVAEPPLAERNGLARAYAWGLEHNSRKNLTISIPPAVRAGIDVSRITWGWSGTGDSRVLTINCGGQLTNQQRTQAQNIADTQFGAGKVVIVA